MTPYKRARNAANMPVEQAAKLLSVSNRTLLRYESGDSETPPETVFRMSQIYRAGWLIKSHCKQKCDIGRHIEFVQLNNINHDPLYVLGKLREELQEALVAADRMIYRVISKHGRWGNFSEAEIIDNAKDLQEFLNVKHNIGVFEEAVGTWVDVPGEIRKHNDKCYLHGYAVTKTTANGPVPDYIMAIAETAASYSP